MLTKRPPLRTLHSFSYLDHFAFSFFFLLFYICNPGSFVIFCPLASRGRKLISGVKKDYQMLTKSRPPPDKDIDVGVFSKAGGGGKGRKKKSTICTSSPLKKKGKRQQPHWQLLLIASVESNLSGTREMLRRQSVKHEQRAKSNQPSCFSSLGIFMKGNPENIFFQKKQNAAVGGLTRDGVIVGERAAVTTS